MKLNLGCGDKLFPGFTNVDIRKETGCDLIDDVGKLYKINDNDVELVYACHVLEHFGRHEYKKVLERWFNVLMDDGILRLSVPDLGKVCEQYTKGTPLSSLMGFIYGGQTYKENYHYIGFDYKELEQVLIDIGFKEVRSWDWRETEHSHIDDFSQAYLPHMDKENGVLMSLNIEAIK